jgi:hypothetical protein
MRKFPDQTSRHLLQSRCLAVWLSLLSACARTDFYYPSNGKDVVYDERGRPQVSHRRAIVLNGSDSLGATHVRITSNSLEFGNQGGIDNSTATGMGYRTLRYGIGAAAWAAGAVGVASVASHAYQANQAAAATSNAAASRSAAAISASKSAETIRLAEIAAAKEAAAAQAAAAAAEAARTIPAAGSTIPSVIPSVVTPVVP